MVSNSPSGSGPSRANKVADVSPALAEVVSAGINISAICRHFGIRANDARILESSWGSHIRARVSDASGDSFLLKERPPYLTSSEWGLHHRVQVLAARDGLLPRLAQAFGGGWTASTEEGRVFELQNWVHGAALKVDDSSQLRGFAACLARLHRVAASLGDVGSWDSPGVRNEFFPVRLDKFDKVVGKLRAGMAYNPHSSGAIDDLVRQLDLLSCEVNWDELPVGLLHGDCNHRNALISLDGAITLIDLDDCRKGFLIEDVAWASAIAGAYEWNKESPFPKMRTEFDSSVIASLVDGYNGERQFSLSERRAFAYFLSMAMATSFSNCMGLDGPNEQRPDNLPAEFGLLGQMIRDVRRLTFDL